MEENMIQILVIGHGNFATGILSSMKLIAGEREFVRGVDFEECDSTDVLKEKLEQLIDGKDQIIILTDLMGGSPYNVSVILKAEHQDKKIEVLSGTNLSMVLSAVFSEEVDVTKIVQTILRDGSEAITRFERVKRTEESEWEDGI
jgi:PTS system N-acetylgalactosamine-specific IIA component